MRANLLASAVARAEVPEMLGNLQTNIFLWLKAKTGLNLRGCL